MIHLAYIKEEKYLKTYTAKLFLFCLLLLALFLFTFFMSVKLGFFKNTPNIIKVFSEGDKEYVIVLDAGHGGVDTGANSVTGEYESELCLTLTEKVSAFLNMHGTKTVMTRTEDKLLVSKNGKLSRKQSDLAGRVEFTEEFETPVFVSIHMNTYPLESCKGTQIFYSPNDPESKALADIILNNIRLSLQPDNTRKNKEAGTNIYVLHKLKVPAVLIECGFISNHEEAELLGDEEYQNKLAAVIAESITEFIEKSNGEVYG